MFVYNLHYDTDLSILLYPKTTIETTEKKPFRDDKFKFLNCQVAFTDLFNEDGNLIKDLGIRIYNDLLKKEIQTITN